MAAAAAKHGVAPEAVTLEQDDDVLDTWFSSGLFPFATMGWPDAECEDMKGFYPNTILETGHDILFFWVARMVMMGIALTGKLPFKTVYLHAMVRDKYGRKMSKSLGNVIDPLEVTFGCALDTLHAKVREGNLPAKEVEKAIAGQKLDFPDGIPECGADALRFGLLAYTVQGRDVNLDIQRVVAYRQFCNKLWNATRFALIHLEPAKYTPAPLLDVLDELAASPALSTRDRWILSRLNGAVEGTTRALREHQYGAATTAVYDFWLYDLCDYYLELVKPLLNADDVGSAAAAGGDVRTAQRLARHTLYVCLDHGLRLLHPMMPFLTEELWQHLPGRGLPWRATGSPADPASIMISPWPTPLPGATRPDVEAAFATFQAVVRTGRSLRAAADIPPSKEAVFYVAATPAVVPIVTDAVRDLRTLLRGERVEVVADGATPADCSLGVVNDALSVHLLLKGLVDPVAELKKLDTKEARLRADMDRLAKKMGAAQYLTKTPEEVRVADKETEASLLKQVAVIAAARDQFSKWVAATTSS